MEKGLVDSECIPEGMCSCCECPTILLAAWTLPATVIWKTANPPSLWTGFIGADQSKSKLHDTSKQH